MGGRHRRERRAIDSTRSAPLSAQSPTRPGRARCEAKSTVAPSTTSSTSWSLTLRVSCRARVRPADGRGAKVDDFPNGFYLGASVIDHVTPEMTVYKEEIFGPVLNVMRTEDFDEAMEIAARSAFGNGCCIYTRSGRLAREFKHRVKAGMVGINVGVPAPLAYFPFSGWDYSFFGDLHIQGREAIYFYTRGKVTTSRWFSVGEGDVWHKD